MRLFKRLCRTYLKCTSLSLDTVVGVLAGAVFVTHFLSVKMTVAWWIVLPLSTWVVYTIDRLSDSKLMGRRPFLSKRHAVHAQYSKELWVCVGIVMCIICLLVWLCFDYEMSVGGGVLGMMVLGHIIMIRFSWYGWLKECGVVAVYILGIWYGPLLVQDGPNYSYFIVLGLFGVVVYLNLLLYGIVELEQDIGDGQMSLVRYVGRYWASVLFWSLSVIGVFGTICMNVWVLLGMILGLMILFLGYKNEWEDSIIRVLGEIVFFFPFVYLL